MGFPGLGIITGYNFLINLANINPAVRKKGRRYIGCSFVNLPDYGIRIGQIARAAELDCLEGASSESAGAIYHAEADDRGGDYISRLAAALPDNISGLYIVTANKIGCVDYHLQFSVNSYRHRSGIRTRFITSFFPEKLTRLLFKGEDK